MYYASYDWYWLIHWNYPPKHFFLNSYSGYLIKEIPNGFLCLDTLIHTRRMLLDFWKAKNTRVAARVFLYTFFSSHATSRVFGAEYPNMANHHVFLYYYCRWSQSRSCRRSLLVFIIFPTFFIIIMVSRKWFI